MLSCASRWCLILLKGCVTFLLGFQDKQGLFPVSHSLLSHDYDNFCEVSSIILGYYYTVDLKSSWHTHNSVLSVPWSSITDLFFNHFHNIWTVWKFTQVDQMGPCCLCFLKVIILKKASFYKQFGHLNPVSFLTEFYIRHLYQCCALRWYTMGIG